MTAIDADSGWTTLIPGFLLAGVGVGMINPPLASTAVGVVPVERSGMASGINNTFRQVGIATGIAGLGAVFQHSITHGTSVALRASGQAHEILATAHGRLGTLLESGEVTQIAHSLPSAARSALDHSYRVGLHRSLHDDLDHRRRDRTRRVGVRLRARAQPRLRLRRGATDRAGSRRARRGRRGMTHTGEEVWQHPWSQPTTSMRPAVPARAQGSKLHPRAPHQKSIFSRLISTTVEDGQPGIARIGWIFARAFAQQERGTSCVRHVPLVSAARAQPSRVPPRRGRRRHGHDRSVVTSATTACDNR